MSTDATAARREATEAATSAPREEAIYLDYNATTPMDDRVLDAMLPYFRQRFGNAGSRNHRFGWEAENGVDTAREQVAKLLGAHPKEILFTSGGTESCNLAIYGVARMYGESRGKHIITTAVEHRAVMDACRSLEREGFEVTYLPVDEFGLISLDDLREALKKPTCLVSILWANNEIGTVMPIKEIGAVCQEANVFYHVDACLGLDTLPLDVNDVNAHLVSISAHKFYGPKGVGALYVRFRPRKQRVRLAPIIVGGGQERQMRHGTLNVPGIVGMGKAAALCLEERDADRERITKMRDRFIAKVFEEMDYVYLNGHATERLPSNINISFDYIEGESLIMTMPQVAVSSGSACTSSTLEPSHVMRAIGVGEDRVHTSIRFSIGRFTTEEQIDRALEQILGGAKKLRDMSPLYEMVKEGIDLDTIEWTGH